MLTRLTLRRTCAHPGCGAAAGRVRCQDCGRAFCGEHVAATDFSGSRRDGAATTAWTRFVCGGCAAGTRRALLTAAVLMAREQAAEDRRGRWWTERRP